MYFSIPNLSEISTRENNHQQTYTLYHIHLNGQHFCNLRYSQLRQFHDDLQRANYPTVLFPPKKFFNLSQRELDERRLLLERYLQSIVQNKNILSSNLFNQYFLRAQCETMKSMNNKRVNLTIEFLNHEEFLFDNLSPDNSTNQIFDICLKKFQIDFNYQTYFSLFFYDKQQMNLIRPLFSFESPYISFLQIQKLHPNICLIFKKSYWNMNYDLKLIDNQRTRQFLFIQIDFDIEQSKIYSSCSNEFFEQLKFYREENSFKEYILQAQTLKFYGYNFLHNCSISLNQNQTISSCLLAIGNYELNCFLIDNNQQQQQQITKEFSFKVTRIRCWKVNWTNDDLNLAFEYLIRKDTLQWIFIHSQQAPLISTCLQSMIDEILASRLGAIHPVSNIIDVENQRTNISNGLIIRTQADLDRLNNNKIFDEGGGDDDL